MRGNVPLATVALLSIGLLGSGAVPALTPRPVVDGVPPSAEGLALASERAFDEGRFEEAAHQASLAAGALAQGPRGPAIEVRAREMQMLWGASLLSLGRSDQATSHFRIALQQDPGFAPNKDRFAPPVRRRFERVRQETARAAASTTLEVSGTAGAAVYLNGIERGTVPAAIAGPRGSQGWLWLERGGIRSLAHPVVFGVAPPPIDLDADAAGAGEGLPGVGPPPSAPVSEGKVGEPHPALLQPSPSTLAPSVVAATMPGPAADSSVVAHRDGPSPVVWVVAAAVAVGIAVAVGVAAASSSSHPAMAVSIQSPPGHP
jgi:hypothetical protein